MSPAPDSATGAGGRDRSAAGPAAQGADGARGSSAPRGSALAAYLALGFAALLWGGNAIAGRLAVGEMAPMTLVALRWVVVVVVLAVVARAEIRRDAAVLAASWRYVLALGALGFTLFNALFYVAAHHTGAVNLALFQGAMPALVMLGALVAYGERVRPLQAAGLALTVAGVAIVAGRGSLAPLLALDLNLGDAFMLVASVLYAGYTVALRRRPKAGDLAFFAGMAAGAFATSLPLVAWEIASGAAFPPTPRGWLVLVYIALFPSLVAQLAFMRGVALIGPARAGLFINLVPVAGALLAVTLLGEPFHGHHATALALVLGGIALAETGRR